ncbi:hypothetical protein QBC45DRAFT_361093 [Copromyces sp. CBS 386.78]|nr:hypothetical protein QBC45DRAFT_361093 [Copromyces sp. CBS 386.78]
MNHLFQVILILFSTCPEHARTADTPDSLSPKDILSKHRNDTEFLSATIAPPWVDSPNTRGTGDILFTCLLTLIACIYTAIHPHMPRRDSPLFLNLIKVSRLSLIKAVMAMESFIAPEALLYGAIKEFMETKSLQSDLKQIISRHKMAGISVPDETLVDNSFCYCATMGGFRVSIQDIHPSPSAHLQSSSTHCLPDCLTLSPDGIRLLAELGHLKLLIEHASDIEDKSKADTVQKCLAAGQLCWMIIQCVVRKSQGLPISLLEVHTFAHAFVSVLLYGVWLKKPLDVAGSPRVFIPTKDFEDALALMVQEQFCEAHNVVACLYPERTPQNAFSTIAVSGDPSTMPPFDEPGTPVLTPVQNLCGCSMVVTWIDPTSPISVLDSDQLGMVLPCGFGYANLFGPPVTYHGFYSKRRADVYKTLTSSDRQFFFSRQDKLRVERAMRQIALLDQKPLQSPQPYVNCEDVSLKRRRCRYPTLNYHRAFYRQLVVSRPDCLGLPDECEGNNEPSIVVERLPKNMRVSDRLTDVPLQQPTVWVAGTIFDLWLNDNIEFTSLLMISALSGLNAGIHLAAWNYIFPSKTERQLWRVASLLSPVVELAMIFVRLVIKFLTKFTGPHRLIYRRDFITGGWISFLESWLHLSLYFFLWYVVIGRLYLNVEAFISLRHMPYGVFVMPSWLEVLPHL